MESAQPDRARTSLTGRQRLTPWLEAQVNSGRFPGLEWVDQTERSFRITWKHASRSDWSEQDALILKEWEINAGRFREGIDEPNWPSWKTRFRCALNKSTDIMLKEKCEAEPNPYRVYQFVNHRGSGSLSPPQQHTPQSVSEDSCSYGGPPSPQYDLEQPQQRPSVIHPNIPQSVTECLAPVTTTQGQEVPCTEAQVISISSDLEQVSITDLLLPSTDPAISLTNISFDSQINSGLVSMETDSLKGAAGCQKIKQEMAESNHEFTLILRFKKEVIQQLQVINPHGCRLFYSQTLPENWFEKLYGDRRAEQILVPFLVPRSDPSQLNDPTCKLLEGLELGFNIFVHDGSIYILRRSKTAVFTAPPNTDAKQTIKVARDETPVKIFDYHNDFLPALHLYQQGQGPRPTSQVIVALGQNFRCDAEPYQNLLVSVTVCHSNADFLLDLVMPENPQVEISDSNQYEEYHKFLTSQQPLIEVSQE